MSRRESRVSTGVRQTDALYEFEAFKKKFLLANKHITKLNSTLSVRVEELQQEIQLLTTENLRLRTSEIKLASELKREREKSRKEAEKYRHNLHEAVTAAATLQKCLGRLGPAFEAPNAGTPSPPPARSPRAKCRPPPPDPDEEPSSPIAPRLARAPTISGIDEEDEPEEEVKPPSPARRKSSKHRPRLSASNLPLATTRIPTPDSGEPNNDLVHIDLSTATSRRKPTRRQSGLLTGYTTQPQGVPRPASPAFGSPVRLQAGRAEFQEEIAALNGEIEIGEDEEDALLDRKSIKRKTEKRAKVETPMPASRERKRRREEEEEEEAVTVEAVTSRSKHASSRTALQPIGNTIHDQYDDVVTNGKQYLADPPRDSLPPGPVLSNAELEAQDAASRERRSRKSVNYAEPKLNTKMRRPESVPELRKKRSSSAAAIGSTKSREGSEKPESDAGPSSKPISSSSSRARSSSPPPLREDANGVTTTRRRKSKPLTYYIDNEDEEESDGDKDDEWAPSAPSKKLWGNVNVEGRKKLPGRRAAAPEEGRRHSMAV